MDNIWDGKSKVMAVVTGMNKLMPSQNQHS